MLARKISDIPKEELTKLLRQFQNGEPAFFIGPDYDKDNDSIWSYRTPFDLDYKEKTNELLWRSVYCGPCTKEGKLPDAAVKYMTNNQDFCQWNLVPSDTLLTLI